MAQLRRWFNATIIHAQVKICLESMEEGKRQNTYEEMLSGPAVKGAVKQAFQLCGIYISFQWTVCGRILSTQIVRIHVVEELGSEEDLFLYQPHMEGRPVMGPLK